MRAPASPQLRFLLRGSGLFVAMLALWWWVLLHPLLDGMRYATRAALWLLPGGRSASGVTVEPNGDWLLRVPIPGSLAKQDTLEKAYGHAPGGQVTVRSFKLTIADRIPIFFTLSFPLFWALTLAAPRTRNLARVVAGGTALLAAMAEISLLVYTIYTIENALKWAVSPLAVALWGGIEYLNVNVAPYVAPVLLAVWLHTELRTQIFLREPAPEPAAAIPAAADKPRRGRYRAR